MKPNETALRAAIEASSKAAHVSVDGYRRKAGYASMRDARADLDAFTERGYLVKVGALFRASDDYLDTFIPLDDDIPQISVSDFMQAICADNGRSASQHAADAQIGKCDCCHQRGQLWPDEIEDSGGVYMYLCENCRWKDAA